MLHLPLAAAALVAASATAMLFGFQGLAFSIPSGSMVPTFVVGDYLLFPQFFIREPRRGDIVVHTADEDGHSTMYLRRVVGLPGDRVAYRDGVLILNDEPVQRELAPTPKRLAADYGRGTFHRETIDGVGYDIFEFMDDSFLDNTAEATVPEGRYFGLGDNRDNSSDSRISGVGTIPRGAIFGRACLRFRPPLNFRNVCG